jgi:two-component system nitrogen regulation response regulator GlnG
MIPEVLLAEDDASIALVLSQAIQQHGYRVRVTDRLRTLEQWVAAGEGDAVITDVTMQGAGVYGDGLALIPALRAQRLSLPIIVISAHNTLVNAARAQESGAAAFLPKPFDLSELLAALDTALQRTPRATKSKDTGITHLTDDLAIVGQSPAMQDVYRTVARLIGNDLTVLIRGESGTGKELIARALHELGPRKSNPFHAINMAALPRELIESELFGHERGAFTSAHARKIGAFEMARGGTLFLDEIGDMPLEAQTRLLRVLQQGDFTPVGGTRVVRSDVRVIAATHRDIGELVKNGEFREDLFYRLNVVPLRVPPLRERKEDMEALMRYFFHKAHTRGLPLKSLADGALAVLQRHDWHGNIREMENLAYRLAALSSSPTISADQLQHELTAPAANVLAMPSEVIAASFTTHIESHLNAYFASHAHTLPAPGLHERMLALLEKPLIEHTLRAARGNQIQAARVLGINRNTLRKKIADYGIEIRSVLAKAA